MKYLVTGVRWFFLALFLFLLDKGKLMLWFGLYAVSLLVALIFGRVYCGYVCPMNTLMIPAAWIGKKPQVFHNLVCPFGTLQRTVGRFALIGKEVDSKTCIGCELCEEVCPAGSIAVVGDEKKAVINPALCHQCTNCQKVCPQDSIHYGKVSSAGEQKTSVSL